MFFSHHRVSLPPFGWIAAAKTNHKPILGTFIIEDENEAKELLMNAISCALSLASIAQEQGFDGWLVNIETSLIEVRPFIEFLTTLRRYGVVLLYDCLTFKGEHKCQSALNEQNREWLNFVHGLFLDYSWNVTELPKNMGSVFVGVDVFGRGNDIGSGFKSGEALAVIARQNLSSALFAPAWSWETFGNDESEDQLWNGNTWKSMEFRFGREFDGSLTRRNGSLVIGTEVERFLIEIDIHGTVGCTFSVNVSCDGTVREEIRERKLDFQEGVVKIEFSARGMNFPVRVAIHDVCDDCLVLGRSVLRFIDVNEARVGIKTVFPAITVKAPSYSHFCVGRGDAFWIDGTLWRDAPWINMALQSVLPEVQFSLEEAHSFGSSLRIDPLTEITIFNISECIGTVRLVVKGDVQTNLEMLHERNSTNGWREIKLKCRAGPFVVKNNSTERDLFLGFFSMVELPCLIIRATLTLDTEGCIVSWQMLSQDFAVLDVVVDRVVLARLVPHIRSILLPDKELCTKNVSIRLS